MPRVPPVTRTDSPRSSVFISIQTSSQERQYLLATIMVCNNDTSAAQARRPMSRSEKARPELEPATGFLIVRVAEAIDRRFAARLRPLRLRPRQLHVLRYLDAAGAISQTELADGISVDAANLVQ